MRNPELLDWKRSSPGKNGQSSIQTPRASSEKRPLRIVVLGPEETFSHQAARLQFGEEGSFHFVESINEVFRRVEENPSAHGVVPLENCYEGSVLNVLDLLSDHSVNMEAEVYLEIRHQLFGKGGEMESLRRIYTHPMAAAQCHSWLRRRLAAVPLFPTTSTAQAAKTAAGDPEGAAIAGRLAGRLYGLRCLASDIQDFPGNVTRFAVIGHSSPGPTGRDKTTVRFLLAHVPGALVHALEPLARRNINLTRIESRPRRTRTWEYRFFADVEGHERDENLGAAIMEMRARCLALKRLGSYPRGDDSCG